MNAEPIATSQFEFSGCAFPKGLFYLLRDDKITKTDLLLLFVIDSFVRYGKYGCHASNNYLAKATGASPNYISNAISRLQNDDLKLLTIFWKDGQRYLETDWSRLTIEKEALQKQGYEKSLPLRKIVTKLTKNRYLIEKKRKEEKKHRVPLRGTERTGFTLLLMVILPFPQE